MNILIPMVGENRFSDEQYSYPKPLIDVSGKTMLEGAIHPFLSLDGVSVHAALNNTDKKKYNLDQVFKRAVEPLEHTCTVFEKNTSGALCTAYIVSQKLEKSKELIITNYDQTFNFDINEAIVEFRKSNSDFGLVTFESLHPKWSYIRIDGENSVIEAAEKRPISKNALAGIYYFRNVQIFLEAAEKTIMSAPSDQEEFYISEAINSCVLSGRHGSVHRIGKDNYRKFYDANEVHDHVMNNRGEKDIRLKTFHYVQAFNQKNISALKDLFAEDCTLFDKNIGLLSGRVDVLAFLRTLFDTNDRTVLKANSIMAQEHASVIEFSLELDEITIRGCDIIEWADGKIIRIRAYLEEL